jgi:hypothetical protein
MRKLLCRLFGHESKETTGRHRVCVRCGQQEILRRFGRVLAWEEVTEVAIAGSAE